MPWETVFVMVFAEMVMLSEPTQRMMPLANDEICTFLIVTLLLVLRSIPVPVPVPVSE